MESIEQAFRAGYHCQWISRERRWIFNPELSPGDPEGAFRAWVAALSVGDDDAIGEGPTWFCEEHLNEEWPHQLGNGAMCEAAGIPVCDQVRQLLAKVDHLATELTQAAKHCVEVERHLLEAEREVQDLKR